MQRVKELRKTNVELTALLANERDAGAHAKKSVARLHEDIISATIDMNIKDLGIARLEKQVSDLEVDCSSNEGVVNHYPRSLDHLAALAEKCSEGIQYCLDGLIMVEALDLSLNMVDAF